MEAVSLNSSDEMPSWREIHISYDAAVQIREQFAEMNLVLGEDHECIDHAELYALNLTKALPAAICEEIVEFGRNINQCALLIRGLPLDHFIPPTPYSGYIAPSCLPLANAVHLGLYSMAGFQPIAYTNENNAKLFRHVVPAKDNREDLSSHGSKFTFGYHVDNPDLPLSPESIECVSGCPEILSLMAVRCDITVRSAISLIDSVLANLNRGVIEELSNSNFLISRPDSFGQLRKTQLPILVFGNDGVPYCRYDKANTLPLTPEAAAALLMFEAELDRAPNQIQTLLLPGDIMILKNQRVLHKREGYSPRDDGADRWLIRVFGMHQSDRLVIENKTSPHIGIDS